MLEFNIASADGDNVLTAQSAVLLNIPVEVNYYVKISDILYQDGMIYLLLNNTTSGFSSRTIYSRGCVLIYNTLTHMLTSDIVGWSEGIANTSAFKTGTQVGEYGDYLLYESYTDQYDKSTGTPLIYDFSNSSLQCSS